MDIKEMMNSVASKASVVKEITALGVKKYNLERTISKLHKRLGERVDYLFKYGKSIENDEIVKGFIEEIRRIEKDIEQLSEKIDNLKSTLTKGERGDHAAAEDSNVSEQDTKNEGP